MNRSRRLPLGLAVAAWMIVGFLAPMIAGWVAGVRDTQGHLVHDEHCYLLQADTFASGRLTNPTPRHFEFFESPHVMLTPSYQAKYLPLQAVFLAIGQRYFGHPIYGTWITCGLFAGGLYWMLRGWLTRTWAGLGTLNAVGVLGVTSYWAQSYWGGMVAATAGALVLGGTGWTLRCWRPLHGFCIGLGAVMLLCSRPFEGAVICLACAPVLAGWLMAGSWPMRLRKLILWGGPFALICAAGIAALGTYNHAVVGNWKTMPYGVYHKQYFRSGLFRWQPVNVIPERKLTTRVADYYEQERPGHPGGPKRGWGPMLESAFGALLKNPGRFFYHIHFLERSRRALSIQRLLEYPLIALYLTGFVLSLRATRRWGRVRVAHLLLVLSAMAGACVWWKLIHYRAPFVCLYYFLAADLLRRGAMSYRRRTSPHLPLSRITPNIGLAMIVLLPLSWWIWGTEFHRPEQAVAPKLTRSQLLARLASQPQPALAFVSYDAEVSSDTEWVYNLSDLATSRVVLAHDMGADRNRWLIEDFPDREPWQVRVTLTGAELLPYVRDAQSSAVE